MVRPERPEIAATVREGSREMTTPDLPESPPDPPSAPNPPAAPSPPSPPWYGGVVTGLLGLTAAILLSYTLADWNWQQRLGSWNYATAAVLIGGIAILLRRWRPDRSTT
jgi:hypothetical protein